MTAQEVETILRSTFGEGVVSSAMDSKRPSIRVAPERWHEIAMFLRDDERLQCNMLRCISGIDWPEDNEAVGEAGGEIGVVYELISMRPGGSDGFWAAGNVIAIQVRVPREGGHVPTVSDVWPAADWHEREAYDLLGVTFDGHPDPRRILCPDDWVGHPLRKDYAYPTEYHGIPGTVD